MNQCNGVCIYVAPKTGQMFVYNGDDLMLVDRYDDALHGLRYPEHSVAADNYSLHVERNSNGFELVGVSLNGNEELQLAAVNVQ